MAKPEEKRRQKTIDLYRAMLVNLDGLRIFAERYASLALEMSLSCEDPERREELLEIYRMLMRVPENAPETFYEACQCAWMLHSALHSCNNRTPVGRLDQYLYPYYKRDMEDGTLTRDRAKHIMASMLVKYSDPLMTNWDDY